MIRTTFLIGNGFDINVGFETRYSDFVKYYLSVESDSPIITTFKKIIRSRQEKWADAEIAFGKITDKYLDLAEFLICYKDFCIKLNEYLRNNTSQIDYTAKYVKTVMYSALLKYTDHLPEAQKIKIQSLHALLGGAYQFDFVNFNYTNIFDNCVDVLRVPDKSTFNCRLNSIDYAMSLGDVLHVHGDLSSPLLLGVNDESQIANKEFLKTRKFKRQFIKPLTNVGLQTMRDEKVKKIFGESHVICIFGMSLGATDKIWWQEILSWLRRYTNRYLVIFTFEKDFNPSLSSSFLDTEEDMQNRLFSYVNLPEQEKEALRSQIFVAVNKPLFNFKLSHIIENKESA